MSSPGYPGRFITVAPPPLNGYGTLAVTAASTLLSTLTPGPNAPVYPATGFPNGTVTIKNSPASAGNVWICPFGGTASAAVGIPIAVGGSESYTIPNAAVVTVFATSTATIIVEW